MVISGRTALGVHRREEKKGEDMYGREWDANDKGGKQSPLPFLYFHVKIKKDEYMYGYEWDADEGGDKKAKKKQALRSLA